MIRPFQPKDVSALTLMLKEEGLEESEMGFRTFNTWVYDDNGVKGFFTWRMEYGKPYVVHFCVGKEHRMKKNHLVARKLLKALLKLVKERGHRSFLVNVPMHKSRLEKLVSKYFNSVPYATQDDHKFFLLEAANG